MPEPSASVDAPQGVNNFSGAGTLAADAERVPAKSLKPDWAADVPDILQDARAAVGLYLQLDSIFTPLKLTLSQQAGNRASELAEAVDQFNSDMRAGTMAAEKLQEQLQSGSPDPKTIEQTGHIFRSLAYAGRRYSEWFASGLLEGVGKYAGEKLPDLIGPLTEHLRHAADLIFALFT